MTPAVLLAGLVLAGGGPDAAAAEPPVRPKTEDRLWARSVNRALEEPGRYAAANLFDGDAGTSYCSAPRNNGSVDVELSDADRALLPKVTGVRITPSPTLGAQRLYLSFGYRTATGNVTLKIEGPIDKTPTTLAVQKNDRGYDTGTIGIGLAREHPRQDRLPNCLAEIEFLGSAGPIVLPDLPRAVKADKKRDAELARLTADRAAFARAYMPLFNWSLRNPHKETEDWESTWYRFLPDGSYTAETVHIMGPSELVRDTGPWSISKDGKYLLIDRGRWNLVPCGNGYFCIASWLFTPTSYR